MANNSFWYIIVIFLFFFTHSCVKKNELIIEHDNSNFLCLYETNVFIDNYNIFNNHNYYNSISHEMRFLNDSLFFDVEKKLNKISIVNRDTIITVDKKNLKVFPTKEIVIDLYFDKDIDTNIVYKYIYFEEIIFSFFPETIFVSDSLKEHHIKKLVVKKDKDYILNFPARASLSN